MSLSNNNKYPKKRIPRELNYVAMKHDKSKSWLLHRHLTHVYTEATEWTYVRSVCTVWS